MLRLLERTPRVRCLADDQALRSPLPAVVEQLELCQRALAAFLEDKRSAFPRLYFIGVSFLGENNTLNTQLWKEDNDLLEVLAQPPFAQWTLSLVQKHKTYRR